MSETNETDTKQKLSLGRGGKLELKRPAEPGQVRQSFPHGRTKTVTVEVRKKRVVTPAAPERAAPAAPETAAKAPASAAPAVEPQRRPLVLPHGLTAEEAARRTRALQGAIKAEDAKRVAEMEAAELQARRRAADQANREAMEEARREADDEARRRTDEESKRKAEDERRVAETKRKAEEDTRRAEVAERAGKAAAAKVAALAATGKVKVEPEPEEEAPRRGPGLRPDARRPAPAPRRDVAHRRRDTGKVNVTRALTDDD